MNKTAITLAAVFLSSATVALAAPTTYTVDPNHSWVQTESSHFGVSLVGAHIQAKGGTITIDPEAKTGSATIAMNLSTINSGVDKLTEEMKGADYFSDEELTSSMQRLSIDQVQHLVIGG